VAGPGCASEPEEGSAPATEPAVENSVTDAESETAPESPDNSSQEDADDEEDYTTGDASLDNIRNQDEIGENEILVISFGTSFNDSRRLTIGAIEDAIAESFQDYEIRRGFTSDIIINHIQKRDNILIDNVNAALQRACDNGVKNLVIQPTHLMNGFEYQELVDQVAQYADAFEKVSFGEPLLTSDEDFERVAQAIVDWTAEYDDGETAICFMGHGTEADSNAVYEKMQNTLTNAGHENYFIGTVEAEPSLDDVLTAVQSGEYKRVVLEPLMVVAGDHANNDMAGDEEDSWKTVFEQAGYEVTCLLRGLGENEEIRQIYVEHAQTAVDAAGTDTE
ncbi:MAG: sirohydrochlorin cobaltochelatase, partial [Oscillospiraceae bacterium]|nr:sirohydrochlorin cobaltochelatase [Oscillospiraceae bacterium]